MTVVDRTTDRAIHNVQDIESGEVLFDGSLEPGTIRTLTMTDRYVRVRSNGESSAMGE